MSECYSPDYGFKLKGEKRTQKAENDRFILNFDNKKFVWTDDKGTASYNIKEIKKDGNTYTFWTDFHMIKFSINDQDYNLEIVFQNNNDWIYVSYSCIDHIF